jgi:acyl carrier protein
MDSIMVVELRNYIEKTMNLSISMVDLFTGTVAKLAEQVADKLAAGTQLEELLEQVENMSPQEIQALLGEESAPLN